MDFQGKAIKYGDNVDTDVIIPARYLNTIDKKELAAHCMEDIDKEFKNKVELGDVMVAGYNFGCGSSREHAALVPLYLGVRCVIAKSFARIHVANLINAGILPLVLENVDDYDKLNQGDCLELSDIFDGMDKGKIILSNKTTGEKCTLLCSFSERQKEMLKFGGLLGYTKAKSK